jgi:hypothetical protein
MGKRTRQCNDTPEIEALEQHYRAMQAAVHARGLLVPREQSKCPRREVAPVELDAKAKAAFRDAALARHRAAKTRWLHEHIARCRALVEPPPLEPEDWPDGPIDFCDD